MKQGQVLFWIKNALKYEVVKITDSYIYLAHLSGSSSNVIWVLKGDLKNRKKEFKKTYKAAWECFLKKEIENAEIQIKNDKKFLKNSRRGNMYA